MKNKLYGGYLNLKLTTDRAPFKGYFRLKTCFTFLVCT